MIERDEDIQHIISGHLGIGEGIIRVTVSERRFDPAKITDFFRELRTGHRKVLSAHDDRLAAVVGIEEHSELDEFGAFGQFAGRMAMHKSGLTIVESLLHDATPPGVQQAFTDSLTSAVQYLRSG